jgi:glycosyltransferase domain-containing protein
MHDLTIAIPVFVRRTTLARALTYYRDWPCNIIVADSSPDPWPELAEFKDQKNFTYVRYPGFGYFQKLHEILKTVRTPYYVEIPDDDFLIRTGVESCLKFLRANSVYSGVMGQFGVFNTVPELKIQSKYLTDYLRSIRNPHPPSSKTEERAETLLENFIMWTHCIQKTECALDAVKAIAEDDRLAPLDFWDYLLSWSLISNGNTKVLSILYGVRSKESLVKGDRELKRRIILYGLRAFLSSADTFFKNRGDRFISRQAEQANLSELLVRRLYEDFVDRRAADERTEGLPKCLDYGRCAASACLRDAAVPDFLVAQSEDGICLKEIRADLPLYREEYRPELTRLKQVIRDYPIQRDFSVKELLRNFAKIFRKRIRG